MKFFQIALFYDQYLADFNRRHPGREVESFERQQELLSEDGFSACHYFAEGMAELGHETMMVVANDPGSQLAWQKQNPFPPPRPGFPRPYRSLGILRARRASRDFAGADPEIRTRSALPSGPHFPGL